MSRRVRVLIFPFLFACAGEDRTAATATVSFQPAAPDGGGTDTASSFDDEDTFDPNSPLDGLRDDVVVGDPDAIVGPGDTSPVAEDAPTPPKDAGSPGPVGDTGWSPDWVENADPSVKGCLETFPAICDKVSECGEAQPLLGALGGFCPTVFDAISPILTTGCDQLGGLVDQAIPGGLPLGIDLGDLLPKLIKGCVENFECTPEYLQEFGATLQSLVEAFTQGQAQGQSLDFMALLPQLLDLANKCGGIGNLIPGFDFFGGGS